MALDQLQFLCIYDSMSSFHYIDTKAEIKVPLDLTVDASAQCTTYGDAASVLAFHAASANAVGDGTAADSGAGAFCAAAAPDPDLGSLHNGDGSNCWLSGAGGIWCWGDNDYGKFGNGTDDNVYEVPVQPIGMESRVVSMEAGEDARSGGRGGDRARSVPGRLASPLQRPPKTAILILSASPS